jgi:hypothetical protein
MITKKDSKSDNNLLWKGPTDMWRIWLQKSNKESIKSPKKSQHISVERPKEILCVEQTNEWTDLTLDLNLKSDIKKKSLRSWQKSNNRGIWLEDKQQIQNNTNNSTECRYELVGEDGRKCSRNRNPRLVNLKSGNFVMTTKQTPGGTKMGIRQQTQQERQTKGEGEQAFQRFVCCGGVGFAEVFFFVIGS